MPYAPGIAYRGDQYLYQGLTSAVDRIEREREKAKQDKKLFDSYVTQGEAMGLNPDVLKVQSLGGVAGMVEGQKLKRLQEYRDVQMRGQEAQTEMTRQQIENYGPTQQRMQEESGLRMEQIRGQMAARARHDEALKQFGGRFAELSNQPDPAVLAALRANQEALGAMGAVGVPVEALAEYAPKRQLTGQEIGLEGIKAGLDPQALASFIHYVAPQGQREGAKGSYLPEGFSVTTPSGRKIEGAVSPKTGKTIVVPGEFDGTPMRDEDGNIIAYPKPQFGVIPVPQRKEVNDPRGQVERTTQMLQVENARQMADLQALEAEIAQRGEGHRPWKQLGMGMTLGDKRKELEDKMEATRRQLEGLRGVRGTGGRATPAASPAAPAPQAAPPARRPAEGRIMMMNPEGEMVTAPEASADELVSKYGYKRIN